MSAAKMVADSTQSDVTEPVKRVKKKKNSDKKIKKSKKSAKRILKRKTKEDDEEELLNDPDLDLAKEVKEIGDYIHDRPEMLKQMFNAVRGASLQRALPDQLKDLSVEELQERCLQQLEVMSKKRIRRILQGDDPATISSSGTDESSDDDEGDDKTEEASAQVDSTSNADDLDSKSPDGDADTKEEEDVREDSDPGEWRTPPPDDVSDLEERQEEADEDMEEVEEIVEEIIEVDEGEEEGEEIVIEEIVEVEESEEEGNDEMEAEEDVASEVEESGKDVEEVIDEEVTQTAKKMNEDGTDSLTPLLTKNQMELLELEMRARAIKAMLKKHQQKDKQ